MFCTFNRLLKCPWNQILHYEDHKGPFSSQSHPATQSRAGFHLITSPQPAPLPRQTYNVQVKSQVLEVCCQLLVQALEDACAQCKDKTSVSQPEVKNTMLSHLPVPSHMGRLNIHFLMEHRDLISLCPKQAK